MRTFLLSLSFCLFAITTAFAQPANDSCANYIEIDITDASFDLMPYVSGPTEYTNENATGNPTFTPPAGCGTGPNWSGGGRDVWFYFFTPSAETNLTVSVVGSGMIQPQLAVYQVDCATILDNTVCDTYSNWILKDCAQSPIGSNKVNLCLESLGAFTCYFVRVNDFSLTATPNWGTFQLKVEECIPPAGATCADPTIIPEIPYTLNNQTTCGAGNDYPTSPCGAVNISGEDYIFTYTSLGNECISVQLANSVNFTSVMVLDDCPDVATANCLGSQIAPSGDPELQLVNLTNPGTYYIVVSTFANPTPACTGFDIFIDTIDCNSIPTPIDVDTNGITLDDLIQEISSPEVIITNPILNCANGAFGLFSSPGLSDLGIEEGILLTTGGAEIAEGPNDSGSAGQSNNFPGDPDLDAINTVITNDACILEFDVYAATNQLEFKYVFGSEEYQEFVGGGVNDIFAFFISGPGIVGTDNLALIPGTTTPVSINDLNCVSNSAFYECNNIDPGNCPGLCTEDGVAVQYDGFTQVLTAQADVIPCSTYHLKLAIADGGDFVWDSGVFIEAGSLTTGSPEISPVYEFEPDIDYTIEGCATVTINIQFQNGEVNNTNDTLYYQLEIGGTATNGIDFPVLPDSIAFPPGVGQVQLTLNPFLDTIDEVGGEVVQIILFSEISCGTFNYDTVEIVIQDEITLDKEDSVYVCQGGSAQIGGPGAVTYAWTPAATLDDSTLAMPTSTPLVDTWYYVVATVDSCSILDSVFVQIVDPQIEITSNDTTICNTDTVQLFSINNTNGIGVSWSPTAGLLDPTNPNNPNPFVAPAATTTYIATLTTGTCSVSDSVTVTVDSFFVPTVIESLTICQGDTVQLADTISGNTTYLWTPGIWLNDSLIPNPYTVPQDTITYELVSTGVTGQCFDTQTVVINVLPALADIAEDTSYICKGDTAELNVTVVGGGGTGLMWTSNSGDSIICDTCTTIFVSPSVSTTYYATMNTDACTVVDSTFVRVDSIPPSAFLIFSDTTVCLGDTLITSLTSLAPPEAYPDIQYVWIGPAGYYPDSLTANVLLMPGDTFDFIRIATNNACTASDTVHVNTLPTTDGTALASPMEICLGDTVQLDVTGFESYVTQFYWTNNPSFITDTNIINPIVVPTATTTYEVEIDSICPIKRYVTVTVSPEPEYGFTNNTNICAGDQVSLGTIDNPSMSYLWTSSPIDPTLSGANTGTPTASPSVTTTYYISVISGACDTIDSLTITVIPYPTIAASSNPDTICLGQTTQLDVTTDVGANFLWTTNNGGVTDPNIQNPVATPSALGLVTYTVTISNPANTSCAISDTIEVLVESIPVIGVVNDDNVCVGDLVTLGTVNDPNTVYTWVAIPADPTLTNPNVGNPTVSPANTTTYNLTATSLSGACQTSGTVTITVTPFPTLTLTANPTTVCRGQDVQLNAASNGATYQWTTDNGSLSLINVSNPVGTPGNVGTANYGVTIAAGGNSACTTSGTIAVTVEPDPVFGIIPDTLICPNSSIVLGLVQDAGTNYTWTSNPDDPSIDDATSGTPTVTPDTSTTYTLVTSSASGACSDTGEVTVTLVDTAFTVTDSSLICEGDEVRLQASGNGDFTWTPITGLSCTDCRNPLASPDTTTIYTVTNECGNSQDVKVNVAGNFNVIINPGDTSIPQGNTITLSTSISGNSGNPVGNIISFEWTPTIGLGTPSDSSTTAQPIEDETYTVTVTSEAGCVNSGEVTITVTLPEYGISNSFTPDGDEDNRFFNVVTTSDNVIIEEFKIYARWGQMVYNNDNPNRGWDGRFDGEELPTDVYIYYVSLLLPDGQRVNLKGDVTLLR